MVTGVGDAPGRRANQDETVPFPLAFASLRSRRSRDETTPFLLEFAVVSRGSAARQEETMPFLLELGAVEVEPEEVLDLANPASGCTQVFGLTEAASECDDWLGRALEAHRSRVQVLPELTWRGAETSKALREYAARVASGEELPPFRGPILASDERIDGVLQGPQVEVSARVDARGSVRPSISDARVEAGEGMNLAKLVLGLTLLAAAIVGSAVLGDDAQLRAAGQAISRWFGAERTFESFPMVESASGAVKASESSFDPR